MKKRTGAFLAVLMLALLAVNVFADDTVQNKPDYATDYFMIVESQDGGVNIYPQADAESTKLNEELIPNGTALHIEGEKTDENNKEWAYTEYRGMHGYVPTDDLRPATEAEAIDSEYSLGNGQDADYEVEIQAPDGSVTLYKGPGEKYGEVPGVDEIPNGETLYISKEMEGEDGNKWGQTSSNEEEGWINLDEARGNTGSADAQTVDMDAKTDTSSEDGVELTPATGTGQGTAAGVTPAETVEATPAPKADTASPTPTEAAKATPTEAAKATPTPTPTEAPKATPTEKPQPSPRGTAETASATPAVTPTKAAEATPTEEAKPTPTKAAEATPTEKAEATPTEEAEATPTEKAEATPTEEAEATPTEEAEATPTEKAEATPAEAEQEDSTATAANAGEQASSGISPIIWAVAAGMLIIILILLFFLKKKK